MQKPVYIKIKEDILDELLSLKAHDVIESERVLAEKYKASRMTVRKSIDILVQEGYLYRNKNIGTCVAEKQELVVKKDAINLINDIKYSHNVLYFNVKEADDELSKVLNVSRQELLVRVVKTNCTETKVSSIDDIQYVKKYANDTDVKSISKLIDFAKFLKGGLISQRFIPVEIPVKYANILKIKIGSPIIMIESLIKDPNGNPVAFIRTYNNPHEKLLEIVT